MEVPLTIQETAAALRAGKFTSSELTRALLDKIAALNPTLGAFITVTEETALAESAAADALFAAGKDIGPLQGIPLAVKDIIATKDAPTTANSLVLDPAWGAGYDATVMAKLRAAGMVLLGKTVLNEFATGMPDASKPFPMPQNPWDLERSAAGSSSGTGIAIAAGLALGGLGTDTGGSTRGPASFNGHTGMKQTFGRVSKWGCVPLGYSLDGINPMARSAYDCALMLNVMAGFDPKDTSTVDVPVPDYTAKLDGSVQGLRIGIPTSYFYDVPDLDPEVKAAVLAAVKTLEQAGAIVKEVNIPYAAEAKDANALIISAEAFAYHRLDLISRYDDYGRFTSESITRGALRTGADYVQAQRFRTFWNRIVREIMSDLDVLITPTSVTPATKRADMSPSKQLTTASFTGQWNLAGIPAMAVPVGFSSGALPLPLSMQIISKAFDEGVAFRVGDAYQRLTDWHLKVPPIAAAVSVSAA